MAKYPVRQGGPKDGWRAIVEATARARYQAELVRKRDENRHVNALRLSDGRLRRGRVNLRFCPYVQTGRRDRGSYQALRGQTLRVAVPEGMDAWELLRDMYRFLKGWRPMRVRTDPQRVATREVFEQWDRLAAAVRDNRWS